MPRIWVITLRKYSATTVKNLTLKQFERFWRSMKFLRGQQLCTPQSKMASRKEKQNSRWDGPNSKIFNWRNSPSVLQFTYLTGLEKLEHHLQCSAKTLMNCEWGRKQEQTLKEINLQRMKLQNMKVRMKLH